MTAFDRAWCLLKEEEPDEWADVPDENKGGTCYKDAFLSVLSNPEHKLAHAVVSGTGPLEGRQYDHAFRVSEIELPAPQEHIDRFGPQMIQMVHDPNWGDGDGVPLALYAWKGRFDPNTIQYYTHQEMMEQYEKHGHVGPWGDGE